MPRLLVACEYSGRVRDAFAAKDWDAWSCDLLPSERERTVTTIKAKLKTY
jgi:hypothetical protein